MLVLMGISPWAKFEGSRPIKRWLAGQGCNQGFLGTEWKGDSNGSQATQSN